MRRIVCAGSLVVLFSVTTPVHAQNPGAVQSPGPPAELNFVLGGMDVPRQQLVRSFFSIAIELCADPDSRKWLLNELLLEPESGAAEKFLDTVTSIEKVLYGEHPMVVHQADQGMPSKTVFHQPASSVGIDPVANPQAFDKAVRVMEANRAKKVGRLFGALEREFSKFGYSLDSVDRFIEDHVAPGTKVQSDRPIGPDHRDAAFEKGRLEAMKGGSR